MTPVLLPGKTQWMMTINRKSSCRKKVSFKREDNGLSSGHPIFDGPVQHSG